MGIGIKLHEKPTNMFSVLIKYSEIGEGIGTGGTGDSIYYKQEFESEYFTKEVLPYLQKMLELSKYNTEDNRAVINLNIGNDFETSIWDKLASLKLIGYGVEDIEDIQIEFTDGNAKTYYVEVAYRK